jgi:hypothetical protein
MMFLQALREPKTIGKVEPDFLEGLRVRFPGREIDTAWVRESKAPKAQDPKLLTALRPFTQMLLEREMRSLHRSPWAILYRLNTKSVAPGEMQQPTPWHVDRGDSSLVVANTLTTEFLVNNGLLHVPQNYRLLRQARKHGIFFEETAKLAAEEDSGLTIYHPEPYEIARISGHIHRSPTNESKVPVSRAWLSASIIRHETAING